MSHVNKKEAFTYYVNISQLQNTTSRCWRPPLFIIAKVHNILEVIEKHINSLKNSQFVVARGHNIVKISDLVKHDYVICEYVLSQKQYKYV